MSLKNIFRLVALVVVCSTFNARAYEYHNETTKVHHFDYSDYTVTYTENGEEKTVSITDEATSVEHMMALLRKVYTDPTIPGIHYAYDFNGTQSRKIDYNTYGHLGDSDGNWLGKKGDVYPNPDEDGMTLLLVQVKDSWKKSYHSKYKGAEYIANAYESIKLVDKFVRVDDPQNPGYLFSIDDATNRFFFISKGKPRSTYTKPLYRMFEQISPVNPNQGSAATTSFISDMRQGKPYYCFHDCTNVTSMDSGHWFTISNNGEAYSLRNLTIFIPDRRFEYQQTAPNVADNNIDSKYYNEYGNSQNPGEEDWEVMPRVFMYTATLDASVAESETPGYFKIRLNWNSSMNTMNVPEHFYVYRIDGKNRELLTTIDTQPTTEKSHEYLVEQQVDPQKFYYMITAAPIIFNADGSLVYDETGMPAMTISADSPIRSVVVPGIDPFFSEAADARSRYDVANEVNIYKNKVSIRPTTSRDYEAMKNSLEEYTVTRSDTEGNKVTVATVRFSSNDDGHSYNYEVIYNADSQVTNLVFDDEQPALSGVISSFENATVVIIDRFTASTATNEHSPCYTYCFEQTDGKHSNDLAVNIFKTFNIVEGVGFTIDEVDADEDHQLNSGPYTAVSFDAINDPVANLLEYSVLRVDNKNAVTRVGKAENFNNSGTYHVFGTGFDGNLNDNQGSVYIDNNGILSITDHNASGSTSNKYVPVIETLYDVSTMEVNTYGCDMANVVYPSVKLTVSNQMKSNPFSRPNGKMMGYFCLLRIEPTMTEDINTVYRYRVWRVNNASGSTSTSSLDAETLLNKLDNESGVSSDGYAYGSDYTELKVDYPETGVVYVQDLFTDNALEAKQKKNVQYIVRMYSTSDLDEERAARRPYTARSIDDGLDYFVAQTKVTALFDDKVVTGLDDLKANNDVADVTYYNMMGVASKKPFTGVNIVVTRYTSGRTATTKQIIP